MKKDHGFNHNDERYIVESCCCGNPHAKAWAKKIGYFWIVFIIFAAFGLIYDAIVAEPHVVKITILTIETFIVIAFFVGINRDDRHLVHPFVLLHFVLLVLHVFVVIFYLVVVVSPNHYFGTLVKNHIKRYTRGQEMDNYGKPFYIPSTISSSSELRWFGILAIMLLLVSQLITFWFYDITKRCYHYLRDLEKYRRIHAAALIVSEHKDPLLVFP